MTALDVVAVVAAVVAAALAGLRWLRVVQREHYLPASATRFAVRWWLGFGPNRVLLAVALLGVALSPVSPIPALAAAVALAVGPFRMSLLGRVPGRLVWTRRLRTLAGTAGAVTVVVLGVGAVLGAAVPFAVLAALLSPTIVDACAAGLRPLEERLAARFVAEASERLRQIEPVIVGITGSYGKTSTKTYVAHLCRPARNVVPTPASFNNQAGLSRAINEHLAPGTEVFVAEMGTYGPGEIRSMCRWCPPRIAAITAIGPVHLERFGSEAAVVSAKREIFETAEVAVLNVDDPRLGAVADDEERNGKKVWRCSAVDPDADVCVRRHDDELVVTRHGEPLAAVADQGVEPGNVAVAVAICLELGVPATTIAGGLANLPAVPNRAATTTLSTGATAIDDTFNSNPAGCRAAVSRLSRLAQPGGKKVVVTPGMVELGPRQRDENTSFGKDLGTSATHVIVVGWTNRAALLAGLSGGGAEVLAVDRRDDAVAWVRGHTGPGDVVLYENDLPDHYP